MRRTGFLQSDEARLALNEPQRQADAGGDGGAAPERPVRLKLCPRCSSSDLRAPRGLLGVQFVRVFALRLSPVKCLCETRFPHGTASE